MNNTLHTHSIASLSNRIGSGLIDSVILILLCFIARVLFKNTLFSFEISVNNIELSTDLFLIVFAIFYLLLLLPLMESSGGSFGNRLTGMQLFNIDTQEPVTFQKAFYRSGARFLLIFFGLFPIIISTLSIGNSHLRQAWYDTWNNTIMLMK
jgi:uncharacterized RDD family membrane protein YckC